MTPRQTQLLIRSFAKFEHRLYDLGSLIHQRLFEIFPESRHLFKGDLEQQKMKVAEFYAEFVRLQKKSHYFRPVTGNGGEAIIPGVGALGARHELEYGVRPEHFKYMREALLYAIRVLLGPDYTDEIGQAWAAAYDMIATAMQEEAGEDPGAFAYVKIFTKSATSGPLVVWSDEQLSVGIEQIDNEHKRLVSLLNELHRALEVGTGQGALGGVLNGLYQYTCYHFAHEEILFRRSNYPDYEKHRLQHRNLTSKVLEIYKDFQSGSAAVIPEEVLEFLKAWLAQHIMGSDREFGQYLLANPHALQPE